MGILDCASAASRWRGYSYYTENRVIKLEKQDENVFTSEVRGNSAQAYSVELHIDHPRSSRCNCPHAAGKRIICKHLVATYFAALPQVAENFYENVVKPQEEEERLEEEIYDKVCDFVDNLSEDDLKSALLRLLFDGPDWQYEKFVVENGLYDYY